MKRISIVVPTYNEEENVVAVSQALTAEMRKFQTYDYEILFIDNDSKDRTRDLIKTLCQKDKHIKAIFNTKNFGPNNSPLYGLVHSTGDCAILFCADFQDPVDMIPVLIQEWEKGYKIVSCIKTTSQENKFVRFLRTCYYKLIKKISEVEQIEHFTGFGLYDRDFLNIMASLKDPMPFLRGIVAEFGYKRKDVPYEQQKRRAGKSSFNFYKYYDMAMLSFTSYTKIGLRLATFGGFIVAFLSLLVALVYFVMKLVQWDTFLMGTAPILIGMFFLGAVQLIFLGLLGEYVLSINARTMNRPWVIEEERINFDEQTIEPQNEDNVNGIN